MHSPLHRAPSLRWTVPSLFTCVGVLAFGVAGWCLFSAMEEEQSLEALFRPDAISTERAQAAELWAKRGAEGIPRLKQALTDSAPETREYALLALIYMEPEHAALAYPEVRELCDDPMEFVQANALVLGAKLAPNPEEFASVVASRLVSSEEEILNACKSALRELGSVAVPAVVKALPEANPSAQHIVIEFLSEHVFDPQHGDLAAEAISQSLAAEDEEIRELSYNLNLSLRSLTPNEITAGLTDSNRRIVRTVLTEGFRGPSSDPNVLHHLLRLLRTESESQFRGLVLNALASFGPHASKSFAEVEQWTKDSDPAVRRAAVGVLVRISDETARVVPVLRELVLDAHPEVARSAAQLFVQTAPQDADALIQDVLLPRLTSANVPVQISAAAALSGMPQAAVKHQFTLVRLLAEVSSDFAVAPAVQFELAEALGNMGPPAREAIPMLLGLIQRTDLRNPQLVVPVRALGNIGVADASVLRVLKDLHRESIMRSSRLRVAVVEALGKIGRGRPAIAKLLAADATQSSSARVRLTALRALAACKVDQEATESAFVYALNDDNANVRMGACLLLAEHGDPQETALNLGVLLEDSNILVRIAAAHSLGNLGSHAAEAVPALVRTLDYPENAAPYLVYLHFNGEIDEEVQPELFGSELQDLQRSSVQQTVRRALANIQGTADDVRTAGNVTGECLAESLFD